MLNPNIRPHHYKFPKANVIDISGHLTGNIAQSVQYFARSSRLDGNNKTPTLLGRIEDLEKGILFAQYEIDRLKAELEASGVKSPNEA